MASIILTKDLALPKISKNKIIILLSILSLYLLNILLIPKEVFIPSLAHSLIFFMFSAVVLILCAWDREKFLKVFFIGHLCSLIGLFLIGYSQIFYLSWILSLGISDSVFATMGNPNFLGAYLGLSILFQLFMNSRNKNQKKIQWLFLFFSIALLFATQCRSAIFAVSGAFLFFYLNKIKKSYLIVIFSLLLVFGTHLMIKKWSSAKTRMVKNLNASTMIIDRPLLGHGVGSFFYAYIPYKDKVAVDIELTDTRLETNLHNFFMEILVENGIPFFVLFCFVLFLIWKKTKTIEDSLFARFFQACMLYLLIELLFNFSLKRPEYFIMVACYFGLFLSFCETIVVPKLRPVFLSASFLLSLFLINLSFHLYYSHYLFQTEGTAIGSVEKACKLWPYRFEFCMRKGELELRNFDIDGAIGTFDELLKRGPYFYPALGQKAVAYLMKGENKKAKILYKNYKEILNRDSFLDNNFKF